MEEKDQRLMRMAKKRVGFKNHLYTYIVVNAFLWVMWVFTDQRLGSYGLPWPTFCTIGWGFGLAFHYVGAYMKADKQDQIEREYEKLKNRN